MPRRRGFGPFVSWALGRHAEFLDSALPASEWLRLSSWSISNQIFHTASASLLEMAREGIAIAARISAVCDMGRKGRRDRVRFPEGVGRDPKLTQVRPEVIRQRKPQFVCGTTPNPISLRPEVVSGISALRPTLQRDHYRRCYLPELRYFSTPFPPLLPKKKKRKKKKTGGAYQYPSQGPCLIYLRSHQYIFLKNPTTIPWTLSKA